MTVLCDRAVPRPSSGRKETQADLCVSSVYIRHAASQKGDSDHQSNDSLKPLTLCVHLALAWMRQKSRPRQTAKKLPIFLSAIPGWGLRSPCPEFWPHSELLELIVRPTSSSANATAEAQVGDNRASDAPQGIRNIVHAQFFLALWGPLLLLGGVGS